MKKIIFSAIFIMLISCNTTEPTEPTFDEFLVDTGFATPALVSAPFSKGVNFSGWFESYSAHGIPFTMYTEKDFADAKSLGVDVVRVPVRMHSMTLGAPDYILDPLFLRFLDIAVDWAEKYDLYIIIDNHSFDPVQTTSPDIDKILLPVWAQIAQRYKNRSDYVVYEILNEPHGISDERWGEIQGMAIDTIRQYDANRLIIVGGTSYNSIEKLHAIPMYEDKNLIYTFHFYDPYLFTHQGSNWGGPPLLSTLAGLPFPGNARRIPSIPADLRGTWVESSIRHSYEGDANPAVLSQKLDIATAFSRARGVPVFCGEFGVFMVNSYQEDRVRWYSYVTSALNKRNISWTSWDYYGGFGLFNPGGRSFNHDLNVGVARALGFTPPAQIPRTDEPLNTGFVIFDDYPNHQYVSAGNWGENVDFSLYDQNAAKGDFSIRWGNAAQYNVVYFNFNISSRDLSHLAENGFALEFMARTLSPLQFDVRFVNAESVTTIPWRMRYMVNESIIKPDGQWHTIRIPLSEMSEHGAWVNATREWLPPRGEFDWKSVNQLDFVSEYSDLTGKTIWFDEIKIVKP